MPITFLNVGTEGSAASGNITLGAPATPATDDIWIAAVHSSDQVTHSFTDWTELIQGNGGSTTSRLSVWYHRYAGATPNLTVTHTGGQSPIGGIAAFRGVKTTGSPANIVGSLGSGTDSTVDHSSITPTVNDCIILSCNGAADDNNRVTPPTGFTPRFEDTVGGVQNCYQTTAGTPDGSVALHTLLQTTATATGIVTDTMPGADPWASVLIALEPGAITPTGIASAEAFGTAKINLTIFPAAIASAEAFGTAVVSFGDQSVLPSSIASAEAFGTAQLNLTVFPAAIASAEAFGTPQLNLTIFPSSITSAEAFGTPQLNLTIFPAAIASAEAFGTPQLNLTVFPAAIVSAEAFGTVQLNLTIFPSSITSAEAFGTPQLNLTVFPTSITSAEAFGTAQLNLTIFPATIASAEAFGTASLTPAILPSSIASAEAFGTPQLNLTVFPAAIASAGAFGTTQINLTIFPGTITSAEAFGTPQLNLTVFPGTITSAEAIGTAVIVTGIVFVQPAGIASQEDFGDSLVYMSGTVPGHFSDSIFVSPFADQMF